MSKPVSRLSFAVGLALSFAAVATTLLAPISSASARRIIRMRGGPDPTLVLGNQYYNTGDYDRAIVAFTLAIQNNPKVSGGYYDRGLAYYQKGDFDASVADLAQAIKNVPTFAGAYYQRGLAYNRQKLYDLAIADFDATLAKDPQRANALVSRGYAHAEKKEYKLAADDYSAASRMLPGLAGNYVAIALMYSKMGEIPHALETYQKAVSLFPNNASVFSGRGNFYMDREQYDLAIADYDKAIPLKPDDWRAYGNRGFSKLKKDNIDGAIADFNDAIRFNAKDDNDYVNRGDAYAKRQDYKKAMTDYASAIEINPQNSEAYKSRGELHKTLGDTAHAIADAKSALAIDSSYQPALALLASLEEPSRPAAPAPVVATVSPPQVSASQIVGTVIRGKRVALVIGEANYEHVSPLRNPANDATMIADALRKDGFILVNGNALLNLNKAQFEKAILDFGNLLKGADVALFYYAGHGIQVDGENYLVPVDANLTTIADAKVRMINSGAVLSQMESAGTKLRILFLDACRNNPFLVSDSRAAGGGLAEMRGAEGTVISFATAPGKTALDGETGHSPYAESLAYNLKRPGVELLRVLNDTGIKVAQKTNNFQRSWFSTSSVDGEFYFAGEYQQAPAKAAASPPNPQ